MKFFFISVSVPSQPFIETISLFFTNKPTYEDYFPFPVFIYYLLFLKIVPQNPLFFCTGGPFLGPNEIWPKIHISSKNDLLPTSIMCESIILSSTRMRRPSTQTNSRFFLPFLIKHNKKFFLSFEFFLSLLPLPFPSPILQFFSFIRIFAFCFFLSFWFTV